MADSPSSRRTQRRLSSDPEGQDLPGFARFAYPASGIVVRTQPSKRHGTLSLLVLDPLRSSERREETGSTTLARPSDVALVEFDPDEGILRLQFVDVRDQAGFEQTRLASGEPFFLKSPEGGVWRTRVADRLSMRALPGRGRYSIEVAYRLTATETLSKPRTTAT